MNDDVGFGIFQNIPVHFLHMGVHFLHMDVHFLHMGVHFLHMGVHFLHIGAALGRDSNAGRNRADGILFIATSNLPSRMHAPFPLRGWGVRGFGVTTG